MGKGGGQIGNLRSIAYHMVKTGPADHEIILLKGLLNRKKLEKGSNISRTYSLQGMHAVWAK